jgi:cobalamin biosynthesis Mg chelatase CobN
VAGAVTLGSNGSAYVATESGNVYAVTVSTGIIQWQINVGEPLYAPPVLTLSGALIVPSRISSSIYIITGLAASPSATATASASASATATTTATASSSSSGTASATATSTATIVSITPSSSPILSSTPSSTATSSNNGNNASAKGELDSNTVLALGVSLPVVFISLLLLALWGRGNLRINSVHENKNNNVAEWRQSSRASTQPPVETTSLKSVSVT